jgi:hypothetical protein
MIPGVYVHRIDWDGITVEITYEPDWMRSVDVAHLQIQSVVPERAPLPFTETGYRSHFLSDADVLAGGGPIAYVRAWLDHAAASPLWRAQQDAARHGLRRSCASPRHLFSCD